MRPTTASSTSSAACSSTATVTLASVRANLLVTFARRAPAPTGPESAPAAPAALGEVYRFAARRTPAGWRLTRVATTPVWVSHTPVEPFGPAGVATANRSRGGRFTC